jgi:ribose transport system permease protein
MELSTQQVAKGKLNIGSIIIKYNAVVMLIVLIIVSSFLSESFFTSGNISNILRQNTPLMLASLGMLLVILTGGIDLAVGSIAAVSCMMVSIAVVKWNFTSPFGLFLAVLISIILGFLLGAATGSLVAFLRMAPFVASLSMMTIGRGLAYLMTNGQPLRLPAEKRASLILNALGNSKLPIIGLPYPILISIAAIVILFLVMKYTTFGRLIIATGSNETAVRLAGITVEKYKFFSYAICGALCSVSGILVTSRAAIGTPATGVGYELDAIAACVIGGASLSGGKGTVINTVIGVLVLGLIGNIMNLLSVPAYPQQIIKGLIIIVAVFLQGVTDKKTSV